MYKQNRGMLLNICNDMLMEHTTSQNYNMRQDIPNKIPHCKTNTQQNTLAYTGPTLWYSIIVNININDCTYMNI